MQTTTTAKQTPFQTALIMAVMGQLQTPTVTAGGQQIDYFGYQLAVHKFNLGIMASGMTCRGIKLKDLKNYYGLKGKSAKECKDEFLVIFNQYKEDLATGFESIIQLN